MPRPIAFKIPEPLALASEGYQCVDMHFHTNHSDSPTTVRSAVKRAERHGIGLAITDHNQVSGCVEAASMMPRTLLIPGIEISASDGPHVLLYFFSVEDMVSYYERYIKDKKRKSPSLATTLSTEAILDSTEGYPCVKVAAHPYGYLVFNKGLMKCIEGRWVKGDLKERFDGLEVICGGMSHGLNVKAAEVAMGSADGIHRRY